jgi:endonuclease G
VFNRFWEVVALHHKAVPRTNSKGEVLDINGKTMSEERANAEPEKIAYIANQGVRASRISQAVEGKSINNPGQREIRDRLIALWKSPGAGKIALRAMGSGTHIV